MELLTMILVDEDPIVLKGLLETYDWNDMGFRVAGAAQNGEAALEMMRELQPDVVLTNVRMENIDGLTLIERAKEAGWKTKFVMISAYHDFDYAQKACQSGAVSYLVKPIDEEELDRTMAGVYQLCAEKTYKQEKDHIWESILLEDREIFLNQLTERYLEDRISEIEMEDLFRSLDLEEELEHSFAAVQVGIDSARRIMNQKEYEMKLFLLEMQVQKRLQKKFKVWTSKSTDGTVCYIVDLKQKKNIDAISEMLIDLRKELQPYLVSAVSAAEQGLEGMKRAFHQVNRLYRAASEAGAGILTARDSSAGAVKNPYSLDLEMQIINAVRKNDRYQAKKAYEKFIFSLPGDEDKAVSYMRRLVVSVEFSLADSGILSDAMKKTFREFYQNLNEIPLLKMVNVLYQLLLTIIEQKIMSDQLPAEEYFRDSVSAALTYIGEHLQDEHLSIASVSECVFLNPSYFGSMFKKMMHVPFKRYVLNMRLEKAKELLMEEKERIEDVCELVGIPNQSYFTQLFKENTGVLPEEYKSKQLDVKK